MSQMTRLASTGGVLLTLCGALFGCSARTYVSGTGSTPSQFTHVYITTQDVWFNTNSNATADDSGWAKFTLKTPVTIDLVQESNGTLGQIAGDLQLAAGTYNTILLMPLPNTTDGTATASATALGAANNLEADFVDVSGVTHTVPLILPNPEKGIVVPGASLKVPISGGGLPTTGTTSTTGTTNTTSTTTGTTGTGTGTTSTTSTANKTVTVSFAANFDANRDLHLFNYPATTSSTTPSKTSTQGVLLSSNPTASDLSTTGGISGTLTLTSLTQINSISDRVGIQACAELLSADGSHHVIVACAPVQTDGTFTIYPLSSNSKTPTVYDVVIHGFGIQTIIIKSVSVATTTPSIAAAANTTGAVATTTASGAVSIGTFIPNASFVQNSTTSLGWFYVSLNANTTGLPAGTAVTFYQTLQGSGEVPYAIDEVGIDPFNQTLATPEPLATGNIESGTYSSSGSTITVTSTQPVEGTSTYSVGATAPLFADALGSSKVVPVASSTASMNQVYTSLQTSPNTVPASVPSLSPANSAAVGSITATIPMGAYSQGELLVSHNGAVIGSARISSSGTATVSGLPSGDGNYYLSVILWNTGNEANSVYQSAVSPVTVTAGGPTQVTLTFN